MLIVVENGDVAFFFQLSLNLEATRSGNVLQIDAAKRAGEKVHGIYKFIYVLGLEAKGNGVDAAEGLEQYAFPLHYRHAGLRSDVSKAQYGGAVGDDCHGVAAAGKLIAEGGILLDLDTGLCNAGGVGEGKVIAVFDLHFGHGIQLALPLIVELQRFFRIVHLTASRVVR